MNKIDFHEDYWLYKTKVMDISDESEIEYLVAAQSFEHARQIILSIHGNLSIHGEYRLIGIWESDESLLTQVAKTDV